MDFLTFFIVGVTLLLIETLLPGFIVLGVIGMILIIISWFKTIFALKYGMGLIIILIEIILVSFILKYLIKKSKNKIALINTKKEEDLEDISIYIGKEGLTKTTLRPVGKVLFNDIQIEAISNDEYIDKNIKVKCIKTYENKIYVEKIK